MDTMMLSSLMTLTFTLSVLFCLKASGCPVMQSREVWGGELPDGCRKPMRQNVNCIMIHHTAGDSCNSIESCSRSLRKVQKRHMETNGYCDIGYHYMIGSRGTIYKGRSRETAGAYNFPKPDSCYHVCLIGDYTEQRPSDAMMSSLENLKTCLQKKQTPMKLLAHKDGTCTECPGKKAYKALKEEFLEFQGKRLEDYDCPRCPDMTTREHWEANLPDGCGKRMRQNVSCIMIHHSGRETCNSIETCRRVLRKIQKGHMETNGYCDIAYHYMIGSKGVIYKGRSRETAAGYKFPKSDSCYHVCLIGDYTERSPSDDMMSSLQSLMMCLQKKQNMKNPMKIFAHKDGTCTECPGKKAYKTLKETFSEFRGKRLEDYDCPRNA